MGNIDPKIAAIGPVAITIGSTPFATATIPNTIPIKRENIQSKIKSPGSNSAIFSIFFTKININITIFRINQIKIIGPQINPIGSDRLGIKKIITVKIDIDYQMIDNIRYHL